MIKNLSRILKLEKQINQIKTTNDCGGIIAYCSNCENEEEIDKRIEKSRTETGFDGQVILVPYKNGSCPKCNN